MCHSVCLLAALRIGYYLRTVYYLSITCCLVVTGGGSEDGGWSLNRNWHQAQEPGKLYSLIQHYIATRKIANSNLKYIIFPDESLMLFINWLRKN